MRLKRHSIPVAPEVSVSVVDSDPPPSVGSPVTVMCAVTAADPQAAISWYQDGVLIEGETMATVDITLTVEENGATVECRADNGLVRSSSVDLDLERKRWLGRTRMSMTLRRT